MNVICIDEYYSSKWLEWADLHNIEWPKKDVVYTIREAIRTFKGLGLTLEEIHNPDVEIQGATGKYWAEPNFKHTRFTDLQGNPLKINEVLESLKNIKLDIALQLVGEDVSNFDI